MTMKRMILVILAVLSVSATLSVAEAQFGRPGRPGFGGGNPFPGDDFDDHDGGFGHGQTRALERYYAPNLRDHWITTRRVNSRDYQYESTLGYISMTQEPGTAPLYECLVGGRDHMISQYSDCEGQRYLGILGYAFTSRRPGTVRLQRCLTTDGRSHFVSVDRYCEGQTPENLVFYVYR